jgi:hypothetical protein
VGVGFGIPTAANQQHALFICTPSIVINFEHLAVAVRRRHAGPAPSGVIVPSIGVPPAAELRHVK